MRDEILILNAWRDRVRFEKRKGSFFFFLNVDFYRKVKRCNCRVGKIVGFICFVIVYVIQRNLIKLQLYYTDEMFVWKKDESKDVVDSSLCIRKNNGMDVARVWCNPYSTHIVNVSLCKIIKETKYIYIDRVKSSNWNSRKS